MALVVNCGSLPSHQDLRAARSILLLRKNRQTYCTSTSPSSAASRGPVQRAYPAGGGLSSNFKIRLSVAYRVDRLLARQRLALQIFKTMIRIAMPPKADNPRLDWWTSLASAIIPMLKHD